MAQPAEREGPPPELKPARRSRPKWEPWASLPEDEEAEMEAEKRREQERDPEEETQKPLDADPAELELVHPKPMPDEQLQPHCA